MTPVTEAAPAVKLTERINRIEPSATMAVVAEADKLRQQGVDVVDFGAGEPHFSTPQHIKDAAIAAIHADFTKYTAVGGTAELRDAIAHRHAEDFDSTYRREEVIASVGGKHALFNAIQVLVDHGDEVILPVPYWVSFKDIVRYAGGTCVLLESDESQGFRLSAAMIERLITPRTKVIILNSPSNPSGAVMSPADLSAVVKLAAQRGIWVLSDECYVYLNYTGQQFSVGSLNEYREHMVILGSLSKTYAMTGWRLGYALAPAAVTSAMQKLQSQSTSNPTSIVQKAAVAALNGPQQCVEDMRKEYIQLRNHVVEGLRAIPGVKCTMPEGAFYVYPNISAFLGRGGIKTASDLAGKLLREAHVATVPGEGFGTSEHIRISYATSMKELDRGLERIGKFLAGLQMLLPDR
jgi:aspartate aminotransferase